MKEKNQTVLKVTVLLAVVINSASRSYKRRSGNIQQAAIQTRRELGQPILELPKKINDEKKTLR